MSKQATRSGLAERESKWRDRLKRQAESGLSVKTFCQRESISSWAFYQWRARLVKPGEQTPRRTVPALAPAGFIALSAVDPSVDGRLRGGGERFEIKLELGGGVVLHLTRH